MTVERARAHRRNMTHAERRLWSAVRRRQLRGHYFRRQEPVGKYVVDFVCKKQRIVVELGGGQHAMRIVRDEKRTKFLEEQG